MIEVVRQIFPSFVKEKRSLNELAAMLDTKMGRNDFENSSKPSCRPNN